MESLEPAIYCVICSVPIDSVDDGLSSPADAKLANTFIQCLTLDSDYLEDLTSSPFCLKCKLSLEEWDFCQNQMVRFLTRSRQLKASLIAKLLESPGQPVADTLNKLDQKLKFIRQSVERRFHPQVLLEKTNPTDVHCVQVQKDTGHTDTQNIFKTAPIIIGVSPGKFMYRGRIPFSHSSGRFQCGLCTFSCEDGGRGRASIVSHMKTEHYSKTDDAVVEVRSQMIHVRENHTENVGDCANFVQVKLEELNDDKSSEEFGMQSSPVLLDMDPLEINANQYSTVTQGPVMEYVHAGIQVTVVNGKHICGLCRKYFEGKNPRKSVAEHIKRCLRMQKPQVNNQHREPVVVTDTLVDCSKSLEESDLESTSQLAQNYTLNSIPPPEPKKQTPTFMSNLIKQVKPGEYLFRNKIAIYYNDKAGFTCGRCQIIIRSKRNIQRHLYRCEKRGNPARHSPQLSVATLRQEKVPPTFRTELIEETKPGEYLYRDRIRFHYKDNRFTCGQCNTVISRIDNMYPHLRRCEKRQKPGGADNMLPLPQSSNQAPPNKKTSTFPTFKSHLIKQAKPGEYLYRDKIPFYYKDGSFTCGRCQAVITSAKRTNVTSNMRKHLVRCEKRQITGSTTPPPLPPSPPGSNKVQRIESPLPAEADATAPFSFQCYGVPITLKNNWYRCGVCQRTFATFPDVEEHILHTPGHKAQDISEVTEPTLAVPSKTHFACNVCGLQFHGSDSRIRYKDHMTSAHAPSQRLHRPIRPAPALIPVQNSREKQSGLMDLPVSFLLPTRRQPTDTENNGSPEMQATMVESEDDALIIPAIVGDSFHDVVQRVDYSPNVEMDPLELMKIDFDCLEAEMDAGVTEQLLGS